MNETEITILITNAHSIFCKALQQLIETDALLKIVAEACDGDEALNKIRSSEPRIAVLDVDMPQCDGLAVLKNLRKDELAIKVILLTMYMEYLFFNAALDARTKGCVLKNSAISEIVSALRAASRKNLISPILSTLLIKHLTHAENEPKSALDSLTEAERRILKLVAEAKNNQQIANELFISIRTAENHRSNICRKLNLEGKNALLTFALTHKKEI